MKLSFHISRISFAAAYRLPFFDRQSYPPRMVYEINFGIVVLTIIDHTNVKLAKVPEGYEQVDHTARSDVVRPGDLVLDSHAGVWRIASMRDLGCRVTTRIGVARKVNAGMLSGYA